MLGWLAVGLWLATAWPEGPDVRFGPSPTRNAAMLLSSVALLAYAWFHYRVLWRGGGGLRVTNALIMVVTLIFAGAGLVAVVAPDRSAVPWLLGIALAISLLPVAVTESLMRRLRNRRPTR